MITQFQGFSTTSLDELVISPSQFNDFMTDADSVSHPIGALYTSTVRILRHAFWLAKQKETLTKQEYKELLSKFNWEGEEKAYLKIDQAFNIFAPYQLAQVEPRTIFQIALNQKKYQSVIAQMQTLPQITQDAVRSLMKKCHKQRAKKEEGTPTIWRMMPDNKRACQIGPIYNQSVGVILAHMMEQEGRTAQAIVEEALMARYESKYRFVEDVVSDDVTCVVETIQTEAPVYEDVETAPDFEQSKVTAYETSWDKDPVTVETQNTDYNLWYDEEPENQDAWSFEPEEKDDFIEDYELLTGVNIQSEILAPVEKLIQTFQTASEWQEISEVLKTHEDYKQEAWDALTPTERKRVIELTPPTITKLNHAKREGLIMDWRESRPGVYQVKYNGCLFWEIVFEYRVEQFFAQLYSQSHAQVSVSAFINTSSNNYCRE
ncbi:hypothetical protein NIES4071_106940 (plasmid) [Calothrix sp. NIES-4071]|nr:hypothetical protein NIES4071_106940 [Calothrix sp. NIES-4071]BAZ64734.1 hypothetical protein NIES4105_104670 [Calothrix sp. NIES-4105]